MNLTDLSYEIHEWAVDKGFWEHETMGPEHEPNMFLNPSIGPEKIALMHSELSEALESERDGDTNTEEELADTIIRILDFCGWRGYDIHNAILIKMDENAKRPVKHGRNF